MINFNKLIEWNMTRNRGSITYPIVDVVERNKLVSEFLSLWVEAHTVRSRSELYRCRTNACNIWFEIKDLDPQYSLWDVDFKSTGYDQPLVLFEYSRWEHPAATFQKQYDRMDRLESRQLKLNRLRRTRESS